MENPVIKKVITLLEDEEEKLEETYHKTLKDIETFFSKLFEHFPSSLEDWFLYIIEDPECLNRLGMPLSRDIGREIRSLLSSKSGFTDSFRKLIWVRLYETLEVTNYLFTIPTCPNELKRWKQRAEMAMDKLEDELTKREKGNLREIIEQQRWEVALYDVRETPIWLIPLLRDLNDPVAYGESNLDGKKDIFNYFCDLLKKSKLCRHEENEKHSKERIWLSHLLWILETLLIYSKTSDECDGLIKEIVDKINNKLQILNNYGETKKETRSLVPEIYGSPDTDLFFSAGWAMELFCLAKLSQEIHERIKTIEEGLVNVIKKAIEHATNTPTLPHLYHLCLRFWFLLYCWYFKAILTVLTESERKPTRICSHQLLRISKFEKNKTYRIITKKDYYFFAGEFLSRFKKEEERENVFKLIEAFGNEVVEKRPIPKGGKYSLFILGGAGVGKTTFVEKIISELINAEFKRYTPINKDGIENWLLSVEKTEGENKVLVLFVDEVHIPHFPSIFSFMLDPLQEGEISGKEIPYPVFYVFASSAYRNMEEFLFISRKKAEDGDTSMLDFSTRIGKWITLPELWQIPKQKYWVAFKYALKELQEEKEGVDESLLQPQAEEIAKAVALSFDVRNTRDIERKVKEIFGEISKGKKTFDKYKNYLRSPFLSFWAKGGSSRS
jgi:hypothetical protein